jgi:hypothetical protein
MIIYATGISTPRKINRAGIFGDAVDVDVRAQ